MLKFKLVFLEIYYLICLVFIRYSKVANFGDLLHFYLYIIMKSRHFLYFLLKNRHLVNLNLSDFRLVLNADHIFQLNLSFRQVRFGNNYLFN